MKHPIQTVEFEHVSSSTFAQVFRVLAQVIRVFQVLSSSSSTEFVFLGLKLVEYSSFKWLDLALVKMGFHEKDFEV